MRGLHAFALALGVLIFAFPGIAGAQHSTPPYCPHPNSHMAVPPPMMQPPLAPITGPPQITFNPPPAPQTASPAPQMTFNPPGASPAPQMTSPGPQMTFNPPGASPAPQMTSPGPQMTFNPPGASPAPQMTFNPPGQPTLVCYTPVVNCLVPYAGPCGCSDGYNNYYGQAQ